MTWSGCDFARRFQSRSFEFFIDLLEQFTALRRIPSVFDLLYGSGRLSAAFGAYLLFVIGILWRTAQSDPMEYLGTIVV